MSSFYNGLGATDVANLISNPQVFFGEGTAIVQVESTENGKSPIGEILEYVGIDSLDSQIKSGSGIKKTFSDYAWVYIPYNHDYQNGNQALETELTNAGFDVSKMKSDENYILNVAITKRADLRKIYNSLAGTINENSMMVYSGVIDNSKHKFEVYELFHNSCCMDDYCHHRFLRRHFHEDRVSCIYTGDTDLNVVKIESIFGKYWDNVGLIQVPHHGDTKSFNTDILDSPKLCPISVGKNNSYGHPSDKVVIDILSHGSCPIFVTEDKNSIFIQVIIG